MTFVTPDRDGSDADRDARYGWMALIIWFGRYRRRSALAAGIIRPRMLDFYFDVGHPIPGNSCAEQTGGRRA